MAKNNKKPAPQSLRGDHILLKEDVQSFVNGRPTRRARRNARMIERAWNRMLRAQREIARLELELHMAFATITGTKYHQAISGITVYHPDKTRRVQWEIKNITRPNESAETAMAIIQQVISDARENMMQSDMDEDSLQLLEFLISMPERRRSDLKFTPTIQQFMNSTWKNPQLRQAQQMLKDGWDRERSRMFVRLEQLQDDGSWKAMKVEL